MIVSIHQYRGRAVMALHALVGGKADAKSFGPGIPAALEVPHARLIVMAGDHEACLDPAALRPVAVRTGFDVMGIWVDPLLSGHRFLIDAVLSGDKPSVHPEHSLSLGNEGNAFLVPSKGEGVAIAITAQGLRLARELPFTGEASRLAGIARGQAHLQAAIFGGSPFAKPIERGLAR